MRKSLSRCKKGVLFASLLLVPILLTILFCVTLNQSLSYQLGLFLVCVLLSFLFFSFWLSFLSRKEEIQNSSR